MPETRPTCPICGRPSETGHRPFCSLRCADRDLANWFSGTYRVPGPPLDPDDLLLQDEDGSRRPQPLDPEDGLG